MPWKKTVGGSTVDDYLANVPSHQREALSELRKTIKAAAPGAEERISYQIPTYKLGGPVAGFAANPNHLTFHLMSPKVISTHKKELAGFDLNLGSIRFTPEKPVPKALVTKLVKARIAELEGGRPR
jgi:uncharacterized protein YdhG (YjbR/CyaY superfamily)